MFFTFTGPAPVLYLIFIGKSTSTATAWSSEFSRVSVTELGCDL
jgi:hypothetical protein